MNIVKTGKAYINLDNIACVEPFYDSNGRLSSVTIYFVGKSAKLLYAHQANQFIQWLENNQININKEDNDEHA